MTEPFSDEIDDVPPERYAPAPTRGVATAQEYR
jgi:hypothetical protein